MFDQSEKENITKWQLQTEELVQLIEYDLRRLVFRINQNGRGEWVAVEGLKPKMNEIGIRDTIALIRTYLNKDVILSDLTEADVNQMSLDFADTLCCKLVLSFEEYGIMESDMDGIMNISNLVYMALKRPKNAGEREFIKATTQITQAPQPQEAEKPKTMFGSISSLFGGGGNK